MTNLCHFSEKVDILKQLWESRKEVGELSLEAPLLLASVKQTTLIRCYIKYCFFFQHLIFKYFWINQKLNWKTHLHFTGPQEKWSWSRPTGNKSWRHFLLGRARIWRRNGGVFFANILSCAQRDVAVDGPWWLRLFDTARACQRGAHHHSGEQSHLQALHCKLNQWNVLKKVDYK